MTRFLFGALTDRTDSPAAGLFISAAGAAPGQHAGGKYKLGYESALGSSPSAVPGVDRLNAMNIDPEESAAAYRERMVAPYRSVLPAETLQSMEEQLSGSCTMEIAAFDEFSSLLGDDEKTAAYDHVIFDTAPTGHTLRLLSLPGAWSSFIETNTTRTSCLGPLAGLEKQQMLYQASVKALADSTRTVVLVSRPEQAALREVERTYGELRDIGVSNQCRRDQLHQYAGSSRRC